MDKDLIRDYLLRSEMAEPQSEALSQIFGQMARRDDLVRLEDRFTSFEERMDQRFRSWEEKIDERFRSMDERLELRFRNQEDRIATLLAEQKSELSWRAIAIVGFFATLVSIVVIFAG